MTKDWNKPTSRCIDHIVPEASDPDDKNLAMSPANLTAACLSCCWIKNSLGIEVVHLVTAELTELRREINNRRRAKGMPWNAEYATPLKDLTPAQMKDPTMIIGPQITPMEIVDMASTAPMTLPTSEEKDTHAALLIQQEREERARQIKEAQDKKDAERGIKTTVEDRARLAEEAKQSKAQQDRLFAGDDDED